MTLPLGRVPNAYTQKSGHAHSFLEKPLNVIALLCNTYIYGVYMLSLQ